MNQSLSTKLEYNISYLKNALPLEESYDFIQRNITFNRTEGFFLGINGLCDTDILQDIFSDLQFPFLRQQTNIDDFTDYIRSRIGYVDISLESSWDSIIENVLTGPVLLLLDGFDRGIILDVRKYPKRSIEEPESETVTKGSRDGFVETLSVNTSLIRRRMKTPELIFEKDKVGKMAPAEIAVAYLSDNVNHELLKYVKDRIRDIDASTLTMGAQSLAELLLPRKWYHPMPSILITERPDIACSYLAEGHILILVDNSPGVLILPCSVFQFTQCIEDYYKNPLPGSYFRLIRFLCIPISLLTIPTFMLIAGFMPDLSQSLNLVTSGDIATPRLIFYVLVMELLLDLFKYSSSIASDKFSGSLSIVGGLIIGDMAIDLNWTCPEVLFYGALTLLASLSISNLAFSEAIRIYRFLMTLATCIFGVWGYWGALIAVFISFITTPTFGGFSYFWPLVPFNSKALKAILFRSPTYRAQPVRSWNRGKVSK